MADSDVKLVVTADASQANSEVSSVAESGQQTAQALQQDLSPAIQNIANEIQKAADKMSSDFSAAVKDAASSIREDLKPAIEDAKEASNNLGTSLDEAGSKAGMTAGQLKGISVAMAGMAIKLGGDYLKNQGNDAGADYLGSVGGGIVSGAAMGGMVGGPMGAVIGGVSMGGVNAISTYLKRDSEAKRQAEAEEEAARRQEEATERTKQAFTERLEEEDRVRKSSQELADFFARLADTSVSAATRQNELNQRIQEYADKETRLRDDYAAAVDSGNFDLAQKIYKDLVQTIAAKGKMEDFDIKEVKVIQKDITGPTDSGERGGTGSNAGITADRLAKIGGFVGASIEDSNAAMLESRKQTGIQERILDKIDSGTKPTVLE